MSVTVKRITITACIIASLFFISTTIWIAYFVSYPTDSALRLEYLKFTLEVYKAIGIGFLITLLGALIPNILPEAKYEFDKLKEGREVYSKAKTGIDYLPFRLAQLSFEDGIKHIEAIHQLKHLADPYIKEMPQVGQWPYDAYATIDSYRKVVVRKPKEWDEITRDQRLEMLLKPSEE